MFDPQMALLSKFLAAQCAELEQGAEAAPIWARARAAVIAAQAKEPELDALIETRDAAGLRALVDAWASGKRLLPEPDREVLKRAMKAYRKSFKVTRLDAESSVGGGPMSAGRHSAIVGITPPDRYGREVWDELVRQGRLLGGKHGVYELPPE